MIPEAETQASIVLGMGRNGIVYIFDCFRYCLPINVIYLKTQRSIVSPVHLSVPSSSFPTAVILQNDILGHRNGEILGLTILLHMKQEALALRSGRR